MKSWKLIIAMLVTAVILCGIFPMTVLAADEAVEIGYTYADSVSDLTDLADAYPSALEVSENDGIITVKLLCDVVGRMDLAIANGYIIFDANGHSFSGGQENEPLTLAHYQNVTVELIGNGLYTTGIHNTLFVGIDNTLIIKSATVQGKIYDYGNVKAALQEGYDAYTVKKDGQDVYSETYNTEEKRLTVYCGLSSTLVVQQHNGYTVSFAPGEGTGTMADAAGVMGELVLPESGFTAPSGKHFKAWNVDGVEMAPGEKITVTADTTLTAVWEKTVSYDLWVGGQRITNANAGKITGEGISGAVTYDHETATLTLDNATITSTYEFNTFWGDTADIYSEFDLNIQLVGNNTITGTQSRASSYGIYIDGAGVRFTGDGKLTVSAADLTNTSKWSVGIFARNNIVIEDGCSIIAYCGNCDWMAKGIYSYADVQIPSDAIAVGNRTAPNDTDLELCTDGDIYRYQYVKIASGSLVTLNTNGGTVNSGNVTYYFRDTGAVLPTDVVKTYAVFDGWYDNADLTGEAVTEISAGSADAREYWAKWTDMVARVDQTCYLSVSEAMVNSNGQIITILKNTDEAILITGDVTVDLAGCSLSNVTVAEGGSLKLVDTVSGGTASVTGNVETFTEADGSTYLVTEENGVYSAHSYRIIITHISLDANNDALGYKAQLIGDEVVCSQITGIGYQLWVNDGAVRTYTTTGKPNVTLRLKNILAAGGGEADIHVKAFVILAGETITSTQQTVTMKETLQIVNGNWTRYTDVQQSAVRSLCFKFLSAVRDWGLDNILTPAFTTEEITVADETMTVYGGSSAAFTLSGATVFAAQDTPESAAQSPYADWVADFYISMDAQSKDGLYLAGNYGGYGWIAIGVEAGQTYHQIPLIESMLNTTMTYTDVVEQVGTFSCGVADTLGNNTGATVTIELRLTNPADPAEYMTLCVIEHTITQ